ncbi:MAG: hemolysin III family protein [Lachnospiraceae bacterium]|nr:hemolysin III family protein [Lachnospiraceae bacterium]
MVTGEQIEVSERFEEQTQKIEEKYNKKAVKAEEKFDKKTYKVETKRQKKLLKAKREYGYVDEEEYKSVLRVLKAKVDEIIPKQKKSKKKTVKPSRIPIPKYSLGEELISSISHGLGVLFGVTALVLCIIMAASHGSTVGVVSSVIYGASMIIMYLNSTLYHSLKVNKAKRVFRVLDHCCIFLLIAGTYTPYTLVSLDEKTGWIIFGLVWGISILGIVLNAVNVEKFKVFSMIAYIALGWLIIFKIGDLIQAVPMNGVILVAAGGVVYTLGAIVYGIGSKVKYVHSVWHFFVLGGSILQFFSIYLYVL